MAIKYPLASGLWSNAANWNGGTKPVPGDVVHCDSRIITVDEDINVAEIRNDARSGGSAGGYLVFSVITGTRTVSANLYTFTQHLLSVTANSGLQLVVIGNLYGSNVTSSQTAIILSGVIRSLSITGNLYTGVAAGAPYALSVNYGPTDGVVITGNLYGSTVAYAAYISQTGAASYTFQLNGVSYYQGLYLIFYNTVCTAPIVAGTSEYAHNYALPSAGTSVVAACNVTVNVVPGARKSGVLFWVGSLGYSATVNGNIETTFPTTGVISPGITIGGLGTIIINGNIQAPNSNTNGNVGINFSGAITGFDVIINGNLYGPSSLGTSYSAGNSPCAFVCPGNCQGTLTVNGDVYGGTGTALSSVSVSWLSVVGTIIVNGTVYAGSGALGHGIYLNGNVTTASVYARKVVGSNWPTSPNSNYAVLFQNLVSPFTSGVYTAQEEWQAGGLQPVNGARRFFWDTLSATLIVRKYDNTGVLRSVGETSPDYPAVSNVRDGTLYNFGSMEGTLVVPPASAVASGTPVDNTVGTAVLTEQNVADAVAPLLAAFGS